LALSNFRMGDKSEQKILVLLYDPRGLTEVTIIRPGVAEVLQMVLEPTVTVSRAHRGQMRRTQ
jgi:hypothetical protein